jgi:peptide chain release factor 2
MVKDLRTGCEMGDAGRVLDGDIDPFINAYLKWINVKPTEE